MAYFKIKTGISILLISVLVLTGCRHTTNPLTTQTISQSAQPSSSAVDADKDGINDSIEGQLITRFAPVVYLAQEEQYLPANVPWFLPRVRMRYNVRLGFDDSVLPMGKVNLSTLLAQKDRNQPSGFSSSQTEFFLEETDVKGGDSLDEYRKATRAGTGQADWVCYAHVRFVPGNADLYDVQYIFFYGYNGNLLGGPLQTAHEADLEHVTVRVKADLKTIDKIYYAAHDGEGKWYTRQAAAGVNDGYALTADSRPVVYSAVNSHASYPWAGKWERGTLLPDDNTDGKGPVWDCRQNAVNVGEKSFPMKDMQWIQYSGHWGEIGSESFTTGPYGPAYQSWWDGEEG